MNIFEALNEGKGRATLPEKRQHCVTMYITSDSRYNFVWSNDLLHGVFDIELRSNDWIPYVPRETCYSCGQVRPSPKKKHTEVFEDVFFVKESTSEGERIYLYPYTTSESLNLERFLNKPPMKITLEWEE